MPINKLNKPPHVAIKFVTEYISVRLNVKNWLLLNDIVNMVIMSVLK